MLASGSRGAPYTCLRCQLRQVIFHTRRRCINRTPVNSVRSFSATSPRRDQEDDALIPPPRRNDRPYVYHHPLGRIVGAPGRRQRQGSQTLKIDAMKKPFEVIIMQDVREPKEKPPRPQKLKGGAVLRVADIEQEMAMEGRDPTQDEVNEAIGALRPDTTLLDGEHYKELAESLADGFTIDQLHAFLSHALNLSAIESDTVHLLREKPSELATRYRRTQWRPGRTRLEKRVPLGAVVRKSEKTNKTKLVEQILRLAWNLSIHAEEQQIGELEMQVQSWEMKYLFDVHVRFPTGVTRSPWQMFVDSDFLLRACDIRPFWPHNIVRISGRRRDAEEVASRLELKLPSIHCDTINLDVFAPLLKTPGWPASLDKLFRREDIDYIRRTTQSIIDQPQPSALHIYSPFEKQRVEARRLLLEMLELPTPISTIVFQDGKSKLRPVALPEAAGTTIHLRHQRLSLTRLTLPAAKALGSEASATERREDAIKTNAARRVQKALTDFTPPALPARELTARSQWQMDATNTCWSAQLCRILRADVSGPRRARQKSSHSPSDSAATTVVNAQVHHLETLLSYFVPREHSNESAATKPRSLLVARFAPSPFRGLGVHAMSTLPTIELTYNLLTKAGRVVQPYLVNAQAIFQKQDLRVPLPSEATDLRFTRWATMLTKGSTLVQNRYVEEFTQILRESLQAEKITTLEGRPHVKFLLPAACIPGADAAEGAVDKAYNYMFAGFEQTSRQDYVPVEASALPAKMDVEMKSLLESFKEKMFLQLRRVAAGAVGGKRTEVLLMGVKAPNVGEIKNMEDRGGDAMVVEKDEKKEEKEEEKEEKEKEKNYEKKDGKKDRAARKLVSPKAQDQVDAMITDTALGLAKFLTRISEKKIQPLVRHEPQSGVGIGEEGESEAGTDAAAVGEAALEVASDADAVSAAVDEDAPPAESEPEPEVVEGATEDPEGSSEVTEQAKEQ